MKIFKKQLALLLSLLMALSLLPAVAFADGEYDAWITDAPVVTTTFGSETISGKTVSTVSGFTVTYGTVDAGVYDDETGVYYNPVSINSTETCDKLVDGDTETKWCVNEYVLNKTYNYGEEEPSIDWSLEPSFHSPISVWFYSSVPIVPTGYILTTGNDTETYGDRNPKEWKIEAYSDTTNGWVTLAEVTDDTTLDAANNASYPFNLSNNSLESYQSFRFTVSAIGGYGTFQLSEFKFIGTESTGKSISDATIGGVNTTYTYTGSAYTITPTLSIDNDTTLTRGTDYDVTLDDVPVTADSFSVTDIGGHTLVFTGKGDYSGRKVCVFGVAPNGLTIDPLYYGDFNHIFYICMPQNNTSTENNPKTFAVPDYFTSSFTVYGENGLSGNYNSDSYSGWLLLTVPAGWRFTLKGYTSTIENATPALTIYDSATVSDNPLCDVQGHQHINGLHSTSGSLLIHFTVTGSSNSTVPGIVLSVTPETPYALGENCITGLEASYPSSAAGSIASGIVIKDRFEQTVASGNYTLTFTKDTEPDTPVTDLSAPGYYTVTVTGNAPYTGTFTKRFMVYAETLTQDESGKYQIGSDADWLTFANMINNDTAGTYAGAKFRLTQNVKAMEMVGTEAHPFNGKFYGENNTVTVEFNTENGINALFRYVSGNYANGDPVLFDNFTVAGSIEQTTQNGGGHEAGLIGAVKAGGFVQITSVIVSVDINTANSNSAGFIGVIGSGSRCNLTYCKSFGTVFSTAPHNSGFIGLLESGSSCNFDNCLFKGKLRRPQNAPNGTSTSIKWGGFVGEIADTATFAFSTCVFDPIHAESGEHEVENGYTFVSGLEVNDSVFASCYYTELDSWSMYSVQGTLVTDSVPSNQLYTQVCRLYSIDYYQTKDTVINGVNDVYYYTGEDLHDAICSAVSVTYGGVTLTWGTDYQIGLSSVTGIDNYTLRITGYGAYQGEKKVSFFVIYPLSGGVGTESDPYRIATADDWERFADNIARKYTYEGKYVALTEDITVTRMAGIFNNSVNSPFSGTFTGRYNNTIHTLTFNYTNNTEQYTAPFRFINGATIKDLRVDGTITAGQKYAAGVAGRVVGNCLIENCLSSVTINSTVNGDGTHGGFVGTVDVNGTELTIRGCVFNGKMLYTGESTAGYETNSCGGFIGWNSQTVSIENSLFAPTELTIDDTNCQTFARGNTPSLTRCYNIHSWLYSFPIQGFNSYSVTLSGDGIAFAFDPADDVVYDAGGLTVHTFGITYGGVFYGGSGGSGGQETIYFSVTPPAGQVADSINVSYNNGAANPYDEPADINGIFSISMPPHDVTVRANFSAAKPALAFSMAQIRGSYNTDTRNDIRFLFTLTFNKAKVKIDGEWYGCTGDDCLYELNGFEAKVSNADNGTVYFGWEQFNNIYSVTENTFCTVSIVLANVPWSMQATRFKVETRYAYKALDEQTAGFHYGDSGMASIEGVHNSVGLETPPAVWH